MEHDETRPPLTFTAHEAAEGALWAGLSAHSPELGLPGDWIARYILGLDPEGAIKAGIRFFTALEWLFVHMLWVAEPYRGRALARISSPKRSRPRANGVAVAPTSIRSPSRRRSSTSG